MNARTQTKQRIYCYVDETGQDTLGELFIVSVVVTASDRDALVTKLEEIEQSSGKGKAKWMKARGKSRLAYIRAVLSAPAFKGSLYFSMYRGSKAYMALTVLSTAKAILSAAPSHSGSTVYVDGLPKSIALVWDGAPSSKCSQQQGCRCSERGSGCSHPVGRCL